MTGTATLQDDANSGSNGLDWDFFERRLTELGGTTDEKRAEIAGLSVRTYYRLQSGEASVKLTKLREIAERIGVTSARLQGITS